MSIPGRIFDGDFTVPEAIEPASWEWPFDGVVGGKIITRKMMIDADSYSPLALDTVHPTITDAYLVKEDSPTHVGGGIITFNRVYAQIPSQRLEPTPYSWTRPAFGRDSTSYTPPNPIYITAQVTAAGSTTLTIGTHSFSVNDVVRIVQPTYSYALSITPGWNATRIITATTSTTITVSALSGPFTFSGPYRCYVDNAVRYRPEATLIVTANVIYDYWLPGVTPGCSSLADIPVVQKTQFITNEGIETNTLTTTSAPTVMEYLDWSVAGRMVVPEPSEITRWRGNIWQRATRYVRAD